jgi:hypothetical protein
MTTEMWKRKEKQTNNTRASESGLARVEGVGGRWKGEDFGEGKGEGQKEGKKSRVGVSVEVV